MSRTVEGLSVRAYARHRRSLGLPGGTHRAVSKALEAGRILALPGGGIDALEADRAWAATTLPSPDRPGAGAWREARARRDAARAALLELKLARRRAELVESVDVEREAAEAVGRVRARLSRIPADLRRADPSISKSQAALLSGLVGEALGELADGWSAEGAP